MRLYLAGPMRGIKDSNREAFKDARERLRDMRHEVFCPWETTETMRLEGKLASLKECMSLDFQWICEYAEGMVMLPGWPRSKGALAEVHLAWSIGIPVYEYELFVRRVIREVKVVPSAGG